MFIKDNNFNLDSVQNNEIFLVISVNITNKITPLSTILIKVAKPPYTMLLYLLNCSNHAFK